MSEVKYKYDILNPDVDKEPFKIRLKDCAWEGIIYSYTSIKENPKPVAHRPNHFQFIFDYVILDESENFDINDFKTEILMNEFEFLLGTILEDILKDLD
jgi:hypothetical protein